MARPSRDVFRKPRSTFWWMTIPGGNPRNTGVRARIATSALARVTQAEAQVVRAHLLLDRARAEYDRAVAARTRARQAQVEDEQRRNNRNHKETEK